MAITLNGTTGITTPDLTSTDDITANSSAVLTSASLPTALNATGSAPIYAARAWVNFNGTGTVAIRAAGNVSSITDNGTGSYSVNFTNAMVDSDICVTGSTGDSQISGIIRVGGVTASLASINSRISNTAAAYDDAKIYIAVFS